MMTARMIAPTGTANADPDLANVIPDFLERGARLMSVLWRAVVPMADAAQSSLAERCRSIWRLLVFASLHGLGHFAMRTRVRQPWMFTVDVVVMVSVSRKMQIRGDASASGAGLGAFVTSTAHVNVYLDPSRLDVRTFLLKVAHDAFAAPSDLECATTRLSATPLQTP